MLDKSTPFTPSAAESLERLAALPVERIGRPVTPEDQAAIDASRLLGLDRPWKRVPAAELVIEGEYALRRLADLEGDPAAEQLRAYFLGTLDGIAKEAERRLRRPDVFSAGSRLDPQALERLRERISVPEYALFAVGVKLTPTGNGRHKGLCPFHKEQTPSFTVWSDHFKCFGCGLGGDLFELARLAGKLEPGQFVEAVLLVATWAGLDVRTKKPRSDILRLGSNGG